MSTRVLELWDQRPIRLAVSALSAVVLVVGLVAFVRSRETKPVNYAANPPAPSMKQQLTAKYGPKIPVPAAAKHVTRQLITDGVLRKDPLAARKLVSAQMSAAATDQQWAQGTLPIPEFPAKQFTGAGFKAMRSRARDVLFLVTIGTAHANAAPPLSLLVELVHKKGRWVVIQVTPPNNSGVPTAQ
jgi:hypothetical protein